MNGVLATGCWILPWRCRRLHDYKTLSDYDLNGKIVLLRLDLNVPMSAEGRFKMIRVYSVIPTIHACLAKVLALLYFQFGAPTRRRAITGVFIKANCKNTTLLLKHPVQFAPVI